MKATRFLQTGVHFLYGCYAWIALLVVVVPVTILLIVLPGIMRRRRVVRDGARLVCWLVGSPLRVTGWTIPEKFACIVVANHASYLDGIILTAVLPPRFAFLIKREMANVPIAGFVLKQIASEFVDRQNPKDRHRMARRLVETARNGWTLAVFPEGTFNGEPGLRRFHTGAFKAAWGGSLPVLPVAITGARHKMPSETFLARPGGLAVHICEPLEPKSYATLEAFIAAVRASMLTHLDEPDLEEHPDIDIQRRE